MRTKGEQKEGSGMKETTKEIAYEKFEQLTPEQQALVLAWMDNHAN